VKTEIFPSVRKMEYSLNSIIQMFSNADYREASHPLEIWRWLEGRPGSDMLETV